MQNPGAAQTRPVMTLPDAVKQVIRKYAEFRGRATRAEFWWWELGVLIAGFALGSVDASIASFGGGNAYSPLGAVFGLATFLPSLAVSVRRLHDIGKSGWWLVGFYAAGIFGWIPIAAGLTVAAINGLFDSVWSAGNHRSPAPGYRNCPGDVAGPRCLVCAVDGSAGTNGPQSFWPRPPSPGCAGTIPGRCHWVDTLACRNPVLGCAAPRHAADTRWPPLDRWRAVSKGD